MSSKRPEDVGAVSAQALDVLERYTMFPWPLLKTQSERRGFDPKQLDVSALAACLDELVAGIARFTSAEKADRARQELASLIDSLRN